MALEVFLTTKNLGDVLAALTNVGDYVANRVLPKAGAEAGQIILAEVKALTPVDTGNLRESMGVEVSVSPTAGVVEVRIGPRPGHRWHGVSSGWRGRAKWHDPEEYGWYQEEGFYHVLARRKIQGRRYMRRGMAASRDRALDRIRQVIQRGVDEAARAGRVRGFFRSVGRFFGLGE